VGKIIWWGINDEENKEQKSPDIEDRNKTEHTLEQQEGIPLQRAQHTSSDSMRV